MSSIDVVVPCFQYGRFLRDSVGSVLSQGVASLRVLIIDNGSTDDSLDVARELASEDKRIEIIAHERNLGQATSLNEGIDWARADYFMTLDADDLLAAGALKRAMSILDEDSGIAFCHGAQGIIAGGQPLPRDDVTPSEAEWKITSGEEFIGRLCATGYNFVGNPTVVRRTKVQKAVGYYDPELRYANDMNMWLRLATQGSVAETSALQGIRRLHERQLTQAYRDAPVMDLIEHLNNFEHFFGHEGRELPAAPKHRAKVQRRIAYNGLYMAGMLLLQGRVKQSLPCLGFSVTTYAGLLARRRSSMAEMASREAGTFSMRRRGHKWST